MVVAGGCPHVVLPPRRWWDWLQILNLFLIGEWWLGGAGPLLLWGVPSCRRFLHGGGVGVFCFGLAVWWSFLADFSFTSQPNPTCLMMKMLVAAKMIRPIGWEQVSSWFAPEPGKVFCSSLHAVAGPLLTDACVDSMSRSDDPNDYVAHDTPLEKGKEKFNKMQAREKRRQREGAGKSLN